VEEYKVWKDLPVSWSVPVPGQACKMTELVQSDPEFMEVERNVQRTLLKTQPFEMVSVSETSAGLCLLYTMLTAAATYKLFCDHCKGSGFI